MNTSLTSLATKTQIEAELCKRSLHEFVKRSWFIVEPSTKFIDNWHIQGICKYLEACVRGDIRNLIINIPPRHCKSLLMNVFFPAWVWSFAPEKKFLFSSYAEDLAIRDSVNCRKLVTSTWYQERFELELTKDQNQKSRFENTKGGYRISVGVGGGATGEGGDYIITDDPLKAQDASSEATRNTVNFWWNNTMSTRLNDPQTGVKLIIQQRLHEDDLTGHLLKGTEKYELLVLPAEYEGERFISSIGFRDPRTEKGELLWPERFGQPEIQSLKNQLSEIGIAGQLQQRPSPVSGSIFKKDWFLKRYENTDIVARYISWDTASSVGETAAYSSATVGELTSDYRLFIREVYREKLAFPQLRLAIEDLAKKYKYNLKGIIIESKSSGISVAQTLQQSSEDWIREKLIGFTPTSDKINRATLASLWCENGSVFLPPHNENYKFLYEFEEELFSFPNSRYKDQVDSFNQLIIYLEHYLSAGWRNRNGG